VTYACPSWHTGTLDEFSNSPPVIPINGCDWFDMWIS
jgi:hypothetical protein